MRSSPFLTSALTGLTVMVDSYFWKVFPLWPEFSSVYFNIYEGKSSDWGVSKQSYGVAHGAYDIFSGFAGSHLL